MKKLSLLMLLSVFVFWGYSNDDDEVKNEVTISFENQLTEENSEFISNASEPNGINFQKDTFKDSQSLATFEHSYADWGSGYSFASFTYTNKTDNETGNSPAPICGKAKIGKVYLAANSSEGEWGNSAFMTINNPDKYSIKGAWITNSTWAYIGMTEGDGYAKKFKAGSWFKAIAVGYNSENKEIGRLEYLLADYKTDTDLPIKDWVWFDMSSLKNAVKINFVTSSSDPGTANFFCLDGITLIEK